MAPYSYYASEKRAVERYLSPVSGNTATITFPLFSGLSASFLAAITAAPEDIPTRTPSVFAISLPVSRASSFST